MMVRISVNASTHARRFSWATRWIASVCLLLFVAVGAADAAHFHPRSGPSKQHCPLCISAHIVARPAQIGYATPAPPRCIAVVILGGQSVPDLDSILSLYIRPPPAI